MEYNNLKAFMADMTKNHTVGNSIVIYLDGKIVLKHVDGLNDLENNIPFTGDELYNIYSCSKVCTVTAATQLLEKGVFLTSDPLYEYMPEFKKMYIKSENGELKEAKNPITIGDLFGMSAGFTYDLNSPGILRAGELTNGKYDTVKTIQSFASDPIMYEPGTRWAYSLAHDVLAGLVSVVSGKKFRDYVKENIFEPIGMNNSYFHTTPDIEKCMAEQYTFVPVGENNVTDFVEAQRSGNAKKGTFKNVGKGNSFILGDEYDSGGAGIITTVDDYAKFAATLANYGTALNGEKILSHYSVELMRQNRLNDTQLKDFNWPQLIGYGYGLGVRTHMNPTKSSRISNPGEFGWCGAAGSAVIVDPKINLAVFYAQHVLNPREEYYLPRLTNAIYSDL